MRNMKRNDLDQDIGERSSERNWEGSVLQLLDQPSQLSIFLLPEGLLAMPPDPLDDPKSENLPDAFIVML